MKHCYFESTLRIAKYLVNVNLNSVGGYLHDEISTLVPKLGIFKVEFENWYLLNLVEFEI